MLGAWKIVPGPSLVDFVRKVDVPEERDNGSKHKPELEWDQKEVDALRQWPDLGLDRVRFWGVSCFVL